jgi:hypothetical protein
MDYLNKYAAAVLNLQYFLHWGYGDNLLFWLCLGRVCFEVELYYPIHILGTIKIYSLQEWIYKYVYINTKYMKMSCELSEEKFTLLFNLCH